nr:MAG TPA: hypothetical protein [Caudoviricetes sp.]
MTHRKPLICTILAALAASAVAQTLLELAKFIIDRIRTILGPGPPTHTRTIRSRTTNRWFQPHQRAVHPRPPDAPHHTIPSRPKPSTKRSNHSPSRSRTSRQPLSTTNPPPHPQKRCDLRKRAAWLGRGAENHCQ